MKNIIKTLLLTYFILISGLIFSQELFMKQDKVYGPDPLVYNGKKYSYFLPSGTGGHQFRFSEEFVRGSIIVRGKIVNDVLINFDVYNQKLLLKFFDETGSEQILEVSEAWLEGFSLHGSDFKYLSFDGKSKFYQVLGKGKYQVLYHWRKNLELANAPGTSGHTFTKPVRSQYVMMDEMIRAFRSNGSFIKTFNPALKEKIRDYLHDNDISVKNAPDEKITDLINYISNL
jgi:hypothetical protein